MYQKKQRRRHKEEYCYVVLLGGVDITMVIGPLREVSKHFELPNCA